MRRAGKRDRNHAEVRTALRDVGCSVLDLGNVGEGCSDLLVAVNRFRTFLLEVKDGSKVPSARKLTPAQEKFRASWRGEYHVVYSRRAALDLVGARTATKEGERP